MNKLNSFNDMVAAKITKTVGSMWCAYVFAIIALQSIKDNLHDVKSFIAWLSSQFLQLILLPIIMVGTAYLNKESDRRAQEDHERIKDMFTELSNAIAELKSIHTDEGGLSDRIASIEAELKSLNQKVAH